MSPRTITVRMSGIAIFESWCVCMYHASEMRVIAKVEARNATPKKLTKAMEKRWLKGYCT